jgi:hypothetical protein
MAFVTFTPTSVSEIKESRIQLGRELRVYSPDESKGRTKPSYQPKHVDSRERGELTVRLGIYSSISTHPREHEEFTTGGGSVMSVTCLTCSPRWRRRSVNLGRNPAVRSGSGAITQATEDTGAKGLVTAGSLVIRGIKL